MRPKIMRLLAIFDLPMETSSQRRDYRLFRKYLLSNGFMMLQKSVYCRLLLNAKVSDSVLRGLRNNSPVKGAVFVLSVTEHQFATMSCITGYVPTTTLASDEFTVYL